MAIAGGMPRIASLAFSVNRLERQTRFAATARTGDDRQFSERKIDVDSFKIVLARAANLNAIVPRWSENALFFPEPRTHWKQFQIAARFANSGKRTLAAVLAVSEVGQVRNLCRKQLAEKNRCVTRMICV